MRRRERVRISQVLALFLLMKNAVSDGGKFIFDRPRGPSAQTTDLRGQADPPVVRPIQRLIPGRPPVSFFNLSRCLESPLSVCFPNILILARCQWLHTTIADLEFFRDRLAMKRLWLVTLLLVTSCGDGPRKPPPIAQDLDVSIENKEWPERLAQHFPVGTAEVVVLDTLQSQGFAIDRRARTAKAHWTKGICEHDVDVSWQAGDAGKITGIGGRYFPTCP